MILTYIIILFILPIALIAGYQYIKVIQGPVYNPDTCH